MRFTVKQVAYVELECISIYLIPNNSSWEDFIVSN